MSFAVLRLSVEGNMVCSRAIQGILNGAVSSYDGSMDENSNRQAWSGLDKNDKDLLEDLFRILSDRVSGNPYAADGQFAASLAELPQGLRAMAATHWLDLSLTLDSITWHFGNFGESNLVAETEAGLRELGIHGLAECFAQARDLMMPLLARRTEADGNSDEILDRNGLTEIANELNERASTLGNKGADHKQSAIYAAWVRYARTRPENVFEQ